MQQSGGRKQLSCGIKIPKSHSLGRLPPSSNRPCCASLCFFVIRGWLLGLQRRCKSPLVPGNLCGIDEFFAYVGWRLLEGEWNCEGTYIAMQSKQTLTSFKNQSSTFTISHMKRTLSGA